MILALDVSSVRVGWAAQLANGTITSGTEIAKGDLPQRLAAIGRQVRELLSKVAPALVLIERPFSGSRGRQSAATVEALIGAWGVAVAEVGRVVGTEVRTVHPATWQARFLGKERPRGGPELKAAIMAGVLAALPPIARRLVDSQDAADAVGMLLAEVGHGDLE